MISSAASHRHSQLVTIPNPTESAEIPPIVSRGHGFPQPRVEGRTFEFSFPPVGNAQGRTGRRVLIHPQEALLQQARELQQSASYDQYRKRRVVVEHRLARLVQLGIRQARYFGRARTKFQLYLAATVANLSLVAGKLGLTDGNGIGPGVSRTMPARRASYAVDFNAVWRWPIWPMALLISASQSQLHFRIRAFRPDF